MPHKLLLGFKQNPTTGDDYIDLGGGLNDTQNRGYHLKSYLEGPVTTDEFGHIVRDLTIVVDIDDSSVGGALAKYHAIERYIQQTRIFLKPFKGNWAATTDGTWYSGFCASLTFQPLGATKAVYWDVLGGSLVRDETYLGTDLVGGVLENVTVTLTVRSQARGDLVTLCNLVAMGSAEPPFNPQDTYFNAGWTFATPSVWSVETGPGKFGLNALKWVGSSSTTAYTNENIDINQYNPSLSHPLFPYVSGSIWLKSSGVTGTTAVTIEGYNGTSWSTLATIASAAGNTGSWSYYKVENVALSAGLTKVRGKITTPTSGTVYFDGFAIWRSATVPSNGEYFTGGGVAGFPSTYLYGAVGDAETPCILHVGNPTNGSSGPTRDYTNLLIGAREYNWQTKGRDSIPGLAAQFANGSANTALLWGKNGQASSGSSSFAVFSLNPAASLVNPIIKIPRKYRLLLAYNSNVTCTAVRVSMGDISSFSIDSKLYTRTIPSTGGTDKLFDLGDMVYPPPDTAAQDQLYTYLTTTTPTVYFYFPSGAYNIKFNGFLLVPTEFFAYVYGAGLNAMFTSMADPDNGTVKAMNDSRATYNPANASEIYTSGFDNSDTLMVVPGAMQFEIVVLGLRDATYNDLYAYDATYPYTPTLVYQPRYLSGGM